MVPVLDIFIHRVGKNKAPSGQMLSDLWDYHNTSIETVCKRVRKRVEQSLSFVSLNVTYPDKFELINFPRFAAKTVVTENAGGSSVLSEAAAHMFLEHFTRVDKIILEIEIPYFFQGCSILDSILILHP